MGLAKRLRIPTNPDYRFELAPSEQPEYGNPVTVNNKQLEFANAALAVAANIGRVQRTLAATKRELELAEARLEDFEYALLHQRPPTTADTKSNKLLQCYIRRIAQATGGAAEFQGMVDAVRGYRAELHGLGAELDTLHAYQQAIKTMGERATVYLSWIKDERRATGRNG
jgi:hypothetical protein